MTTTVENQSQSESIDKSQLLHEIDANAVRATELQDGNLTHWQAVREYPFAVLCIVIMVWALISTSFESQAGGIVVSIIQFRKHFGVPLPDGDYVIQANWQSIFSGIPIAGQMIGQAASSYISDRFGKKKVIIGATLLSLAFIGMEFAAEEVELFVAGKTLNGFALGLVQPAAISYVSDVAPLALRGPATTLCNIAYSIGPLICFIINYSLSSKPADDKWAYKAIFSAQWGFAVVTLVLMLFVPESPTYHIIHGNDDKAKVSYVKLLKDEVAAEEQISIIKMTLEEAAHISKNSSYLDLWKGLNWKRTMVAVFPFLAQPNSGVFFTASYTTYYFQLSGFDAAKSFKFTCGAQAISIGGCIIAVYLADKVGRRNGILIGLGILVVTDFLIGGLGTATENEQAVQATIAFMMLYGGLYNALLGSIAYPIAAENPTSALRAKTISASLFATNGMGMVWSFVLPYIFNPDKANLGAKTMFIYAGLSLLRWVYLYFFQTETAGRTYDEIDELYAARIPLRKFKGYVTKTAALRDENVKYNEKLETQHVESAIFQDNKSAQV
jgi:sugar porter (SP) family MFS transporter